MSFYKSNLDAILKSVLKRDINFDNILMLHMLKHIKKAKLKNKTIISQMFRNVLILMIISGLVQAVAIFTDGVCVSNFIDGPSKEATAALQIVHPMILFLNIFGNALQVGCQILCSQKIASGKTKDVGRIFSIAIITAVIVGLIFLLIIMLATNQIVDFLDGANSSVTVKKLAVEYMRGFFIGAPFSILHLILMPLSNLDGGKKIAYVSVFFVLIFNVAGDFIAGVFFKSIFGIGLATSLSFIAGILVILIHFLGKKSTFRFSFKNLKIRDLGEIIIDGLPNGAKTAAVFVRSFLVNRIIMFIGGVTAMSAFSAQSHISPFIECLTTGLIAATLILSSIFYGEEDEDSLNQLIRLIIKYVLSVVLVITVIYIALAEPIAWLYNIKPDPSICDPEVYRQSIIAMRTDAAAIPFVAINVSFIAILQGTKHRKLSNICTVIQSLFLPLIFVCILGFGMNRSEGIWYGLMIGFSILAFIYLTIISIRTKKIPTNAHEMFFLPKNFGYKKEQMISLPINNINDALNLSNQVLDFCHNNNIDNKRTYYLAICVEEIGVMTVISGFTRSRKNAYFKKDKLWSKILHLFNKGYRIPSKRYHCEMRVLYKNDTLILRVRDDCAEFNIKEKADKLNQEDPTRNMAIRLIMGLAKKVDYENILNTNNLIITI